MDLAASGSKFGCEGRSEEVGEEINVWCEGQSVNADVDIELFAVEILSFKDKVPFGGECEAS